MSDDCISAFLDEVLPLRSLDDISQLHVTLTFAQSLDARIAGCGGKQLLLSCKESMIMTHRLRSRHDAILVGIGTALNDDPQLNTRLLPPESGGLAIPLPIILDADLRFRLDSKLMSNYKSKRGRRPTIITSSEKVGRDPQFHNKRELLEREGVRIITIPCTDGKLDLRALLDELQSLGVRSLMVEGGASVISSFLQSELVNSLIVTVCPIIVGDQGITYNVKEQTQELTFHRAHIVGSDAIMAWTRRDSRKWCGSG